MSMILNRFSKHLPVTIPSGAAVSEPFGLGGVAAAAIIAPTGYVEGAISLETFDETEKRWVGINDDAAAQVAVTPLVTAFTPVGEFALVHRRVRFTTAGNVAADRTFTVAVKS